MKLLNGSSTWLVRSVKVSWGSSFGRTGGVFDLSKQVIKEPFGFRVDGVGTKLSCKLSNTTKHVPLSHRLWPCVSVLSLLKVQAPLFHLCARKE